MNWIVSILAGGGAGVIGSIFMEAYYQRRATDAIHDHDPPDHRAGS